MKNTSNNVIRRYFQFIFFSEENSDQKILLRLAAIFLFTLSITLTLSDAAHSKNFKYASLRWDHWIVFFVWLFLISRLADTYKKNDLRKDLLLLPVVAFMSGWGIFTIWRLSPSLGIKQTIWFSLSIGLIIFSLPSRENIIASLRKYKYIWLFSGLILTIMTFIFGTNPTGAGPKLWLGCCGIYLQPAEPLKLLLILYLAAYFADRQPFSPKLVPLIAPTTLMGGVTFLILVFQRDLGTASIFFFIYSGMIYVATEKKKILLLSLAIISVSAYVGYSLFDVVQLRVESWLNPWIDPSGRSFQIVQSLISIASGGMTGRGPGMGNPSLVPIAFSDFIFTAIAEEYGFPGTLGLILLFIIFTFRGLKIGLKAQDRYQRYLASGLTIYIASQTILIIGGNIRLLPLTGVTLPFFSYGGSSLLTTFMAFFLLLSINQNSIENPPNQGRSKGINHVASLLLIAFISLILINAWWAIYRAPELLSRTDNIRRSISDKFNKRGAILDRNDQFLSYTSGSPGNYSRVYTLSEFSHVVGYTHPFYGQTGIEASFDPILRGIENQSAWNIWYYHLLYGESPPGLDLMLTLNTDLQLSAGKYLHNSSGAVVILNANNGEILVLYSYPYFNANRLDATWDALQENPEAPLLNRATQSNYPPGPSLAPFLIAQTNSTGNLPVEIRNLHTIVSGKSFTCTSNVNLPTNWKIAGRNGCPAPLESLGKNLGADELGDLFSRLGFYDSPDIRLEVSLPFIPPGISNPTITAIGQRDILLTPLQIALAAASLSNDGFRPVPNIIIGSKTSLDIWQLDLAEKATTKVFSAQTAEKTANLLSNESLPIWETVAYAQTETGVDLTWYLAGTLPGADPALAIAIVIERRDAIFVSLIGQNLLIEAINLLEN